MAIVTRWNDKEQRTILLEFESEWSWDDLEMSLALADEMINRAEWQVDVIVDLEGSRIPKDFMNAARQFLANPEPRPNEGHRIIVGAGKVIRTTYRVIYKAFHDKLEGREVLFAEDIDDAIVILRSLRLEQAENGNTPQTA